jgi:hypothetical protein
MFDVGGPQFGLADVKIGVRGASGGTYSSIYTVPSVQVLGIRTETVNAELPGNDRITATAAKQTSATVTLRLGSVPIDLIWMLQGGSIQSSGSSPNLYKLFKVTNRKFRAIGLCGKANAEEGNGDMHLFIPNAKVNDGFEVRFEYGAFSIPELQLKALPDTAFADAEGFPALFIPVAHETAVAVSLPPIGV